MRVNSPFDVLGVDADADDAEITRAYRDRVKEAHPDHGGSTSEFQAVQTAYAQLQAGYDGESDEAGQGSRQPTPADPRETPTHVEYVNYEVLDDRQWDIDDEDLFEKAAAADLDPVDYGTFTVGPDESLLEAAEHAGFAWPYACRGGACANCAVVVVEGELSIPVDHILPVEMLERGIRLSCNGVPVTDEMKVVYNVKHLPDLDEFRLPPDPFENAYPDL